MSDAAASNWIGAAVPRLEDRRFITGQERYVAGLERPNALHVSFVRAPVAHAHVRGIDTSAASALPGVVGVWTGRDLTRLVAPFHPMDDVVGTEDAYHGLARRIRPEMYYAGMPALAVDRVRYQGEPVAAVVADDPYVAEDARDLVDVDYEELPAVTDPEAALEADAAQLHDECPNNLSVRMHLVTGDAGPVFDEAPVVVGDTFRLARNCGLALESRGVLAEPDHHSGVDGSLTVYATTGRPQELRNALAKMIGMSEEQIRVRMVAMGGSFGPRNFVYPEYAVVTYLARVLRRPVRWDSDRLEDILSTYQGRGQIHHAAAAFSEDGELLAVRDHFYVVGGAYNVLGPLLVINPLMHLCLPYRVEHRDVLGEWVYTNMAPSSSYRGSGRPEGAFVTDRLMDLGARRLGMDPAEIRLRNMVDPDQMPYDTGLIWRNGRPLVFEDGNYPEALRRALELARYDEVRREQAARRAEGGRQLGIGVAFSIEGGAMGSYEAAKVVVDMRGGIQVISGAASHGQGHETMLAQIAADLWGVSIEDVRVRDGDSALMPFGMGTWGSRGAVHPANAVRAACEAAIKVAREAASHMLEVAPDDLEIAQGAVRVRGDPTHGVSLAELAKALQPAGARSIPVELRRGLEATEYEWFKGSSFSYAADVALVEVDPETGEVELRDYVSMHDSGRILNPFMVDGQIHGGVVQGLSQALWERTVYNDEGQLISGSLMDYLLPSAADVCSIRTGHMETHMRSNPLGTAGMGSGTSMNPVGAAAAAVEDALGGAVTITELPIEPERLVAALEERDAAAGAEDAAAGAEAVGADETT